MIRYLTLTATLLCFMAAGAQAASKSQCANMATPHDIGTCHEGRFKAADRRLNAIYSGAMKNLPEVEKAKLKESQRAWLKFRDASFALVSAVNADSTSYDEIVYNDFKANFVERRVKELRDVFRGPGDYDDMPAWLK
jgi:uncharacterized protein YecT (DUF1311 family)